MTKRKHPLDRIMNKAETVMDGVPEGYRALFVIVDTNGQCHMTRSCCDTCAMKMGQAAMERYRMDVGEQHRWPPIDIEEALAVMERAGKTQH